MEVRAAPPPEGLAAADPAAAAEVEATATAEADAAVDAADGLAEAAVLVTGAALDAGAELAGAEPPPHAASNSTDDVNVPTRDRIRR
ncbi:MAG: hypothetical protein JO247_18595 [Chloroflexi bacterium]|nr:hypothetical protein [Chloroflexota bacterium]